MATWATFEGMLSNLILAFTVYKNKLMLFEFGGWRPETERREPAAQRRDAFHPNHVESLGVGFCRHREMSDKHLITECAQYGQAVLSRSDTNTFTNIIPVTCDGPN